jgi:hypothetical protein
VENPLRSEAAAFLWVIAVAVFVIAAAMLVRVLT